MSWSTILIEALGLLASILIIISFVSNNIEFIRKINLIGCVLFLTYGILIMSISLILINIILFGIHVYKLKQLLSREKVKRKNNKRIKQIADNI